VETARRDSGIAAVRVPLSFDRRLGREILSRAVRPGCRESSEPIEEFHNIRPHDLVHLPPVLRGARRMVEQRKPIGALAAEPAVAAKFAGDRQRRAD